MITTEQLAEWKKICEKATPGPWQLEHNDLYVGADNPTCTSDWYWVTGSMKKPSDGYNAECSDEEMRGPFDVIQRNNQFIATARTAMPELIAEVERLQREAELLEIHSIEVETKRTYMRDLEQHIRNRDAAIKVLVDALHKVHQLAIQGTNSVSIDATREVSKALHLPEVRRVLG